MPDFDAIVLAGGSARRMGGADKPAQLVGGVSLLDRALAALVGATQTVVVGPERPVARTVLWTREQPVGGGPLAALAAGLRHVTADRFVLVAADLPFLSRQAVEVLLSGLVDGRVMVDDTGRPQWLCSAWRTSAVRAALDGVEVDGGRLRSVLGGLRVAEVAWQPAEPGSVPPWTDCDTEDDLRRARERA